MLWARRRRLSSVTTAMVLGSALMVAWSSFGVAAGASPTSKATSAALVSDPPSSLVEYPLPDPNSEPFDLAPGPDGNLWAPYNFASLIARITPAGRIREFPVPSFLIFPTVTRGSDGNIWFWDLINSNIDRMTPDGQSITPFHIPHNNGGPNGITLGPDGNVWFAEFQTGYVGYVTPAGDVHEFRPPGSDPHPEYITAGGDGNVWYTDSFQNVIGRVTPDGVITTFETPGPWKGPYAITKGPDGNVWYDKIDGGILGRVTPTGDITEFYLPEGVHPTDLTAGPDGALWFDYGYPWGIGRITTSGKVGLFSTPSFNRAITTGPDGRLWFVMLGPARVAAFKPFSPPVSPPEVRSVTPPFSGPGGGKRVIVTGYRVGEATKVLFGDTPAQFEVIGPSQLRVVVPPHAPGEVDVTVVTPEGTTATSTGSRFVYTDPRCGKVIKASTTLTTDIGPCYGNGVIIGADNVTLDLGGHRIFGFSLPSGGSSAGVRLPMRTGVTVKNGTVRDFDAGIVLGGGGGNTLAGLKVRDNIGPDDPFNSELGDGIVLLNSAHNTIRNNIVAHNGVFDGIAVLGTHANGNLIQGNVVEDNVGPSDGGPAGQGIIVNAPGLGEQTGVPVTGNDVLDNTVRRNGSGGISNVNSTQMTVGRNLVEDNGHTNYFGNGIGIQPGFQTLQPAGQALVTENTVRHNDQDGIQVASTDNRIENNVSTDNDAGGYGYFFDLHDTHPDCDSNVWFGNVWGSAGYSPECVTAGGSGPVPVPPPASAAQAKAGDRPTWVTRKMPAGL